MKFMLVPVILVLMGLVVVSLVRGIASFLAATRTDLARGEADHGLPSAMQLRQNQMMFNRIKYQGLAIIVVSLLMALSK